MRIARLSLTLVAAAMLATPVYADFVGVSRCDELSDGVYRPGLMTVEADGTRTFHPVGVNGLTETIVFNRRRAMEWVEGQGLFPEGTTFGNYQRHICGILCEECADTEDQDRTNGTNGSTDTD